MTTSHQEPPDGPASHRGGATAEEPERAEGEKQSEGQPPESEPQPSTGAETASARAATSLGRKRFVTRSQLALAGVGLGVGLVTGLALGQLDFGSTSDAIPKAVEACSVKDEAGINMGDGGQSISMQTEGMESAGAAYTDVMCVLDKLAVSDSVTARMETTRALDGRLNGQWDGFSASWGYHPDNGLNVVVEIAETD